MPDDNLSLAELGYATYARSTNNLNYQGLPMPTWEALPVPQKLAWIAAAVVIRYRVVSRGMTAEEEPTP